jgi:hypothetical protein
MFILSPAQAQ